jgi:hypothetical protein
MLVTLHGEAALLHVIASLLHVIASGAKQSILSLRGKMDCFAALAMTTRAIASRSLSSGAHSRDPDGLNPRIDRPPSQKFSSNGPCT